MSERQIHRLIAQFSAIRASKGFSRSGYGRVVEMAPQNIDQIENGGWVPTLGKMDALLDPLGYELVIARKPEPAWLPAHPLVSAMFAERDRQKKRYDDLAAESGVSRSAFAGWRGRSEPAVGNLDACFQVLGLELRPVWRSGDV